MSHIHFPAFVLLKFSLHAYKNKAPLAIKPKGLLDWQIS